jgi:predicted CoA-binding protein
MRSPSDILRAASTIALVGASPRPGRPSNGVMGYLLNAGYRVIPVNPTCDEVLGIECVPSLAAIHEPIDLVDVFRREEHAAPLAREAAAVGAGAFWLQLGLRSAEARRVAIESGMDYVEDLCTAVVHRRKL